MRDVLRLAVDRFLASAGAHDLEACIANGSQAPLDRRQRAFVTAAHGQFVSFVRSSILVCRGVRGATGRRAPTDAKVRAATAQAEFDLIVAETGLRDKLRELDAAVAAATATAPPPASAADAVVNGQHAAIATADPFVRTRAGTAPVLRAHLQRLQCDISQVRRRTRGAARAQTVAPQLTTDAVVI